MLSGDERAVYADKACGPTAAVAAQGINDRIMIAQEPARAAVLAAAAQCADRQGPGTGHVFGTLKSYGYRTVERAGVWLTREPCAGAVGQGTPGEPPTRGRGGRRWPPFGSDLTSSIASRSYAKVSYGRHPAASSLSPTACKASRLASWPCSTRLIRNSPVLMRFAPKRSSRRVARQVFPLATGPESTTILRAIGLTWPCRELAGMLV